MVRVAREESRARTRERLMDAALKAVAEKGYESTSVADIAERAGFSKGAFFANFESKEAMLFTVLRRNFEDEISMLKQLIERAQINDESIFLLNDYFDLIDGKMDYIRFNMQMLQYANRTPSFAPEYFAAFNHYRSVMAELLELMLVKMHKQLPLSAQDMVDHLIAMAHGLILQNKKDTTASLKLMLDLFIRASLPIEK